MARPTRLDLPPPAGCCPACWHPVALEPGHVSVCVRCFVLLACLAPGRLQRLVQADMTRLTQDARREVLDSRAKLIHAAAQRWRAPRPTARPVPVR